MYEAYNNKKDLYAMIAQSAFDNNYEDNLENWAAGTVLEIDGKKVVAGNGSEREEKLVDNSITIKYYELLPTINGDKSAAEITIEDKIISDIGELSIENISKDNQEVTISFKD